MKMVSLFKASVLALAIAGASGTGYGSLMTGVETYQKAVALSQSALGKSPVATPTSDAHEDLFLPLPEYIFAWVLGKDCLINRIGSQPSDPFRKLQGKISDWARVIGEHNDETVVPIIVRVPDSPWDLEETLAALRKHALFYVTDAHTGFIEHEFMIWGENAG